MEVMFIIIGGGGTCNVGIIIVVGKRRLLARGGIWGRCIFYEIESVVLNDLRRGRGQRTLTTEHGEPRQVRPHMDLVSRRKWTRVKWRERRR